MLVSSSIFRFSDRTVSFAVTHTVRSFPARSRMNIWNRCPSALSVNLESEDQMLIRSKSSSILVTASTFLSNFFLYALSAFKNWNIGFLVPLMDARQFGHFLSSVSPLRTGLIQFLQNVCSQVSNMRHSSLVSSLQMVHNRSDGISEDMAQLDQSSFSWIRERSNLSGLCLGLFIPPGIVIMCFGTNWNRSHEEATRTRTQNKHPGETTLIALIALIVWNVRANFSHGSGLALVSVICFNNKTFIFKLIGTEN